jgi:hypothetical protein
MTEMVYKSVLDLVLYACTYTLYKLRARARVYTVKIGSMAYFCVLIHIVQLASVCRTRFHCI